MNFLQIKPEQLKDTFEQASEQLDLSLQARMQAQDDLGLQMLDAMRQTLDIMQRLDADRRHGKISPMDDSDVGRVGNYGLELLDELSVLAGSRGLQQAMLELQRLTIPVALWLADNGGRVERLEPVVNAFAGYANDIRRPEQLLVLSRTIGRVIDAVADDIRQDLEATNPMRPWRILNLNWAIIATRSHDVEQMEQVFARMMQHIPADARGFFREGMQQMDIVGYPDRVRQVMAKYNQLVGNESSLH